MAPPPGLWRPVRPARRGLSLSGHPRAPLVPRAPRLPCPLPRRRPQERGALQRKESWDPPRGTPPGAAGRLRGKVKPGGAGRGEAGAERTSLAPAGSTRSARSHTREHRCSLAGRAGWLPALLPSRRGWGACERVGWRGRLGVVSGSAAQFFSSLPFDSSVLATFLSSLDGDLPSEPRLSPSPSSYAPSVWELDFIFSSFGCVQDC